MCVEIGSSGSHGLFVPFEKSMNRSGPLEMKAASGLRHSVIAADYGQDQQLYLKQDGMGKRTEHTNARRLVSRPRV